MIMICWHSIGCEGGYFNLQKYSPEGGICGSNDWSWTATNCSESKSASLEWWGEFEVISDGITQMFTWKNFDPIWNILTLCCSKFWNNFCLFPIYYVISSVPSIHNARQGTEATLIQSQTQSTYLIIYLRSCSLLELEWVDLSKFYSMWSRSSQSDFWL